MQLKIQTTACSTMYPHSYIYIYICIYTHIMHIYIYIYICIYTFKTYRIETHIHACVYIYIYVHGKRLTAGPSRLSLSLYIYIYTYVCIHMYIYISYICIYIYIHMSYCRSPPQKPASSLIRAAQAASDWSLDGFGSQGFFSGLRFFLSFFGVFLSAPFSFWTRFNLLAKDPPGEGRRGGANAFLRV